MPDIAADIAQALGSATAASGIADLATRIGAPCCLRDLGMPQADLDAVAQEVVAKGTHNPRPITIGNIRDLLIGAWEGQVPTSNSQQQKSKNTAQGGSYVGSTAN